MSENYSPDPGVQPQWPYTTVFLSQRDLGLRIPVNYVTTPGVSLTAACFSHQYYEDKSYSYCLSNLLAVGYRRFEIDLYWDQGRKVWSFCPASIPDLTPQSSSSSRTTVESTSTTVLPSAAATVSSVSTSANSEGAHQASLQSTVITRVSSAVPSSTSSISLGSTIAPTATLPDTPDEPLVTIGPYVCTTTVNLSTFTSQLLDYIQNTQNTLGAHLIYVIINIHAASSSEEPSEPAPQPSILPEPASFVGSGFSSNLSDYIYTESSLTSNRANLNDSWYSQTVTDQKYQPVKGYFTITTDQDGVASTEDGWPSESYIEFSQGKRLLVGWGTIDSQMTGYNFSGDSGTIFPNGYMQDIQTDVSTSDTGAITSGCFLENAANISTSNSSWAVEPNISNFSYPISASANLLPLLNLTTNLTNCGISPLLNTTLLNSTAHENYIPYQNMSYSTIWSWSPGEPRNYTSTDASSSSLFRCATTNLDSGQWAVTDCSQKFYASCRAQGQPYNYTITTYPTTYASATLACPSTYVFAAPRTSLENSYLTLAIRSSHLSATNSNSSHRIWVDFNSLDVEGCWTTGGANATCPYTNAVAESDELKKRVILVPTIAAVIVLIITALTVFVKVVGNRQVSRRGRRGNGNGGRHFHEGVPS